MVETHGCTFIVASMIAIYGLHNSELCNHVYTRLCITSNAKTAARVEAIQVRQRGVFSQILPLLDSAVREIPRRETGLVDGGGG